ncbi:hypothetical protein H4R99_004667 [Coemansia sp. RSA 1722]|nr:hypothetical protein IWW45_002680 [Coemansia sp. RSA 485]KAJ2597026.1 hypothetical protein H4R99_004667 [Coemansia sp. RSA 1722]
MSGDNEAILDLNAADASKDVSNNEEGSQAGDDEEVYVVKEVLEHKKANGKTLYLIRWEGYTSDEDTWEGEENILDEEILKKYWAKQNTKSSRQIPKSTKPKPRKPLGRSAMDEDEDEDEKDSMVPSPPTNKRRRTKEDVVMKSEDTSDDELAAVQVKDKRGGPDSDDWEANLKEIVTIGQYDNDKFFVIIKWKNGHSTEHPIEMTYSKCPQSMLKFYEARLRFRSNDH